MAVQIDSVATFIAAARRVVAETPDEAEQIARLTPLLQQLAAAPNLLRPEQMVCTSTERATRHVLHEEPDHALALWAVVWPPGYSTLPHNHLTWAIVTGLRGAEINTFWERTEGAPLRQLGQTRMGAGDVVTLRGADIHSVANDGAEPSLSLHFYGVHPDTLPRQQFDPDTGAVRPMRGSVGRLGAR